MVKLWIQIFYWQRQDSVSNKFLGPGNIEEATQIESDEKKYGCRISFARQC